VTGGPATAEQLASPDYWAQQIRRPVRFLQGVRALEASGVTGFIELGPDGVLSAMALPCLDRSPRILTPVLRGDRPEARSVASALALAWANGRPVAWGRTLARSGAHPVELPGYAFQRRSYWLDAPAQGTPGEPEFWSAVEDGDPAALAAQLDLPPEQREALATLLPALTAWRRRPQPEAGPALPALAPEEAAEQAAGLRSRLAGLAAPEQEAELLGLVRLLGARVLGLDSAAEIDPGSTFLDVGFTSFAGLELRNLLVEATGLDLPAVIVFDHPTPLDLAGRLRTDLFAG
jgi:acyl transferase domain-containing protein